MELMGQVRRIAAEKLREAFAEIPEAKNLTSPVSATPMAVDDDRAAEARRRGDLLGEKVAELDR